QMLLESVLLASAAGLLGLLGASWIAGSLQGIDLMGIPLAIDLSPDWRVFVFSLAVALVSSLLFGLLPAWRSARPDLVPALKDESQSSGMGLRRFSLRNALVVAQVAGCFVLLSGSLLFLRSQWAARGLDPGFRHQGLAVVRLDMTQFEPHSNPDSALQRTRDFRRRLLARGEVAELAYSSSFPMSLAQHETTVGVEGYEGPASERQVKFSSVSPGYFEMLEIPLVAGRPLRATDNSGRPRVCLVNQAFQQRFWPRQSALGTTLTYGDDQRLIEVAGVVRDHSIGLGFHESEPAVWVPLDQNPSQGMLMAVVRPQGNASGDFLNLLREEVESFTGRPEFLPPAWASEMIEVSLLPNRLVSGFLGWTGALALILALAGLYGVISYSVSLRRREMSIRMALGADRRRILSLVLRQGLSLAAVGFLLGIPSAIGFAALLSHLLYGLSPADPFTLCAIALLLSLCTLAASLAPALHAASTNPIRSLRTG
ncbi:MAG TPA: FtsX-like permease family protein, partial [Acidobacteriota bacterium]|nr:FtsX-like permease family protein [Acidobacteriota bacterium]